MSTQQDWNAHYESGDMPWDVGQPDTHLVDLLSRETRPLQILEVGCGTGTNSVWMAQQGHRVTALDLAPLAVERARARVATAGVPVSVQVANFLEQRIEGGPFDLVYDRGVFHVFDEAADRERFAEQVAAHLRVGGRWLSICGSTEGPARSFGPPRRSARDVVLAVEPHLQVQALVNRPFGEPQTPLAVAAWVVLSQKRDEPAQPGTRR